VTGTGHIPRERAWDVCWPHGGVIFETVRRTQREAREAFLDRWDETRDMKWADARKRYGVFVGRVYVARSGSGSASSWW